MTGTEIPQGTLWTVMVAMAVGCYALRFVFIGLVGDRPMAPWLMRHLRYTAVAILPALVAPLVVWPAATDGTPDPARMIAAALTILSGVLTRNVLVALIVGATSFGVLVFALAQ